MSTTNETAWIDDVKALGQDTYALARDRGEVAVANELRSAARATGALTTIALLGERSRGKSSLLNALAGRPDLLPVNVNVTTNVFTEVLFTATGEPGAGVVFEDGRVERVEPRDLRAYISEQDNPDNERGVASARVRCPLRTDLPAEMRSALSGCVFVDTPGVGGLKAEHADRAFEAVRRAHALVFALEANRLISEPELKFVERIADTGRPAVFVLTMADLHREDPEDAVEYVREQLGARLERFADASVVLVSALDWAMALKSNDERERVKLAEQSGIPALAAVIGERVVRPVRFALGARFLGQVHVALRQLAEPDSSLLKALEQGNAKQRLEQARRGSASLPDKPATLINAELSQINRKLSERMNKELRQHRRDLMRAIDERWSRGLRNELPGRWEAGVEAIWTRAITDAEQSSLEFADRIIARYRLGAPASGELNLASDLREEDPEMVLSEGPREDRVARAGRLTHWASVVAFVSSVVGIPAAMRTQSARRQQIKRGDMQQAKNWLSDSREELVQEIYPALRRALKRIGAQLHKLLDGRIAARRRVFEQTIRSLEHLDHADPTAAQGRLQELSGVAARARELAAARPNDVPDATAAPEPDASATAAT